MRYREIINEKIAAPPRFLKGYVEGRIKVLKTLQAKLLSASQQMSTVEHSGEDMLMQFLKYGSDYADAAYNVEDLGSLVRSNYYGEPRLERYFPISRLIEALESYLKYGREFFKFVRSAMADMEAIDDRVHPVIAILPTAEKGAVDYGYDEASEKDADYVQAMAYLSACRIAAGVIEKAPAIISDMKAKFDLIDDMMAARYNGKPYRPKHEPVEVLYHATINATKLVSDGFQKDRPEDAAGLGNYGRQNTISVTHDYKIAQDILRAFKEVWMIVHRQLSARAICGWMKAEGIDSQSEEFKRSLQISAKVDREPGDFSSPAHRYKSALELTDPAEIVRLYNVYLFNTKIRSNPVFASIDTLVERLKTVDIKDIGIVSCEVVIDDAHEYLDAEREFRITPDAVRSIKRII